MSPASAKRSEKIEADITCQASREKHEAVVAVHAPIIKQQAGANCRSNPSRAGDRSNFARRGLSNKAIALELKASTGTVKVHMHNIFQKLQIKTPSALTTAVPLGCLTSKNVRLTPMDGLGIPRQSEWEPSPPAPLGH